MANDQPGNRGMGNLWLRIKIWSKVILIAAVLIYIIAFTTENAGQEVRFWYWRNHQPDTNLLFLVVCAFVAGIVTALLARTTFRTMRQISELQHRSRIHRMDQQIADIHTKAAMLQTKPPAVDAPQAIERDDGL
jgi:uncharacterized membrane protein YciS (DUF1049 family)